MKLLSDDNAGVYCWVAEDNQETVLSPHFDYEEDAMQWYNRIQTHFTKELPNE